MSKAIVYFYGEPDGFVKSSSMNAAPNDGERSAAQMAEPVVQLMLTEKLREAGMRVSRDGSITRAPWKAAYTELQEGLSNPPPEHADLPGYIVDQIVVQKMFHYSDILDDTTSSAERSALVTQFLDVLVENNYPEPTVVARMLGSVQTDLDKEHVIRIATRALEARRPFPTDLQATPTSRAAYDQAVRTLEAHQQDSSDG
jgi:hypothetical protein